MFFALIMTLACWMLPQLAEAAITRANVTGNACSDTTCSATHDIASANLEGLIWVHWFATTPRTVTDADIGGVAAAYVSSASSSNCAGGYYCGVELWHLTNPAIGSPLVTVNLSASAQIIIIPATYAGVDGTTPYGTPVPGSGTSAAPSVSVVTAVGDVVVSGLTITNAGSSPSWPGASLAYSEYDPAGFTQGAGGDNTAVGTSMNVTWAYGTAQAYALLAVPLKAAGTGGGGGGNSTERLIWSDLSSGTRQETNTRVYWKHTTQPTYQLLATLLPDSLTYTVSYTSQTNRCYVVDQINSAGTSPLSNELCVTLTAPGPIRDPLPLPIFSGGLSDE